MMVIGILVIGIGANQKEVMGYATRKFIRQKTTCICPIYRKPIPVRCI